MFKKINFLCFYNLFENNIWKKENKGNHFRCINF